MNYLTKFYLVAKLAILKFSKNKILIFKFYLLMVFSIYLYKNMNSKKNNFL